MTRCWAVSQLRSPARRRASSQPRTFSRPLRPGRPTRTPRTESMTERREQLTQRLIACETTLWLDPPRLSGLQRALATESVSEQIEQVRHELAALDRAET